MSGQIKGAPLIHYEFGCLSCDVESDRDERQNDVRSRLERPARLGDLYNQLSVQTKKPIPKKVPVLSHSSSLHPFYFLLTSERYIRNRKYGAPMSIIIRPDGISIGAIMVLPIVSAMTSINPPSSPDKIMERLV